MIGAGAANSRVRQPSSQGRRRRFQRFLMLVMTLGSIPIRGLGAAELASPSTASLEASPPGAPASSGAERYQYLSPQPGSRYVSPWNNVVIRLGPYVRAGSLRAGAVAVTGSLSGIHVGTLVLSDDARTVVFKPDRPFARGETVAIRVDGVIATLRGDAVPPLRYSFQVSPADPKQQPHRELDELLGSPSDARAPVARRPLVTATASQQTAQGCEGLPTNYIHTTLLASNHPDPGRIFLAPITQAAASPHGRLLILDNNNMPVFFRDLPIRAFDFKRQANGLLTYFIEPGFKFLAMDSTYTVVDTFRAGNGYTTDAHELVLLPNGHALLMVTDWEPVDMSAIVQGGYPDAFVGGLIVQELDAAKNVVFQWRSWDHFKITDMIECDGHWLTDDVIDWVHGNAIELDRDGNLLISSRHLNEITKIDRPTGAVIWRLGLNAKNNDFGFEGDARGFSHQHDIRRMPNGNITLFDNGNCLAPEYSRGLEYSLDESGRVATFVREYRNTPDIYCSAMGNMQRFADGGTLIGWGATYVNPNVTELHADGSKAWEIGFGEPTTWSYRAFRFPWETTRFSTAQDSLDFGAVSASGHEDRSLTIRNPSGRDLGITCFVSTDTSFFVTDPVPVLVPAFGNATVNVRFKPLADGPHDASLYVRAANDTELVARVVAVRGVKIPAVPVLPAAGLPLLGGVLLGVAVKTLRAGSRPRVTCAAGGVAPPCRTAGDASFPCGS